MKKELEKGITKADLHSAIDHAVDSLARTIKKGFDAVDERFDRLETHVDSLETKFGHMEKSMFEMKLSIETTNDRLNTIEKILSPLMLAVDVMKKTERDHENRITRLEKLLLKHK